MSTKGIDFLTTSYLLYGRIKTQGTDIAINIATILGFSLVPVTLKY
ncbi:hypothetical protein [Pedobacter mendelii]|nr:hypothetical protein [Pedobacter mendelii]